ncbi:MAG: carboxypeptidase-like regulatory domain-containing protein, partial [Pedobacter sp.]
PVIRAIPNAVSGAITGVVSPAASSPKIYAITGTDTLGTITDATGKFWFPGVAAGTYKVEIEPVSPYLKKTIENVAVVQGSVKDLGTITVTQ